MPSCQQVSQWEMAVWKQSNLCECVCVSCFWLSKMVQAGSKKSQITRINSKTGINSLIIFVVLLLAWIAGFSSRLFAVIRFESIIHEFDPWWGNPRFLPLSEWRLRFTLQVQLQSNRLYGKTWFLQLFELVRWASMVPFGAHCGRHGVPRPHDHFRKHTLRFAFAEHKCTYTWHLCVLGTNIQVCVDFGLTFVVLVMQGFIAVWRPFRLTSWPKNCGQQVLAFLQRVLLPLCLVTSVVLSLEVMTTKESPFLPYSLLISFGLSLLRLDPCFGPSLRRYLISTW